MLHRVLDLAAAASLALGLIVLAAPLWPVFDLFRHVWPLTFCAGLAATAIIAIRPTRLRLGATLAGLVLIILPTLADRLRPAGPEFEGGAELTVVTHNLWGQRHDPDHAREILINSGADVVLLQEAWASDRLASGAFTATYPHAAACRNSTRIHSRLPIRSSGCVQHPPETDWQNSSLCDLDLPSASWAELELPGGDTVHVVSVHMDWPAPLGVQACERNNFAHELKRLPQDHLIIAGDFNAAPPSAALHRMEAALGLSRRSQGIATWPAEGLFDRDATPLPTPMIGIDHVFAGRDWQTVSVSRGEHTGSDHRPLIARLRLRD